MNEIKIKAINDFCIRAGELAQWLVIQKPQQIILLHHNDADGISAGAILSKALYRYGFDVRRIALEKPYPAGRGVVLNTAPGIPKQKCSPTIYAH